MGFLRAFNVKSTWFPKVIDDLYDMNLGNGGTMQGDLLHSYYKAYGEYPFDEKYLRWEDRHKARYANNPADFSKTDIAVLWKRKKPVAWTMWTPVMHPDDFDWDWQSLRPASHAGHIQAFTRMDQRGHGYATALTMALLVAHPQARTPWALRSSLKRAYAKLDTRPTSVLTLAS